MVKLKLFIVLVATIILSMFAIVAIIHISKSGNLSAWNVRPKMSKDIIIQVQAMFFIWNRGVQMSPARIDMDLATMIMIICQNMI
jgi:hypothetical protein